MALMLAQAEPDVYELLPQPVPLWWLWLLIAVLYIVVIVWLVNRVGPGGPWFR